MSNASCLINLLIKAEHWMTSYLMDKTVNSRGAKTGISTSFVVCMTLPLHELMFADSFFFKIQLEETKEQKCKHYQNFNVYPCLMHPYSQKPRDGGSPNVHRQIHR